MPERRRAEIQKIADGLLKPLAVVEEEIYQVRNRSGQDPLNYPIRLNNKIAALMGIIESADNRPTDQTYEVFKELSAELEKQLQQMNATEKVELPRLNAALKREKVDAGRSERETDAAAQTKPRERSRHTSDRRRVERCQSGTVQLTRASTTRTPTAVASCSARDARSRRKSTPSPRKSAAMQQRRPVEVARRSPRRYPRRPGGGSHR